MTHQPHDRLAKAVFSETRQAVAFLEGFLPADISERIAFDTLELVPGSFVDEELTERLTDLLFSARIGRDDLLIYLLWEHQSTPDATMPFRFLRSLVRIWDAWRRENPGAHALPPVLPVVFYHGEKKWSAPLRLSEMYAADPDSVTTLRPYLPELRFLLVDLSEMTDAELRSRVVGDAVFALLAMLMMKNVRAPDLMRRMFDWVDLLRRLLTEPTGLRAFETLLKYLFEAGGESITRAGLKTLMRRARATPRAEENVMNLAEKLRREGRQEGFEACARESLIRLLRRRFGDLDAAALARIDAADLRTLQQWLDRVLDAETLGDVFA